MTADESGSPSRQDPGRIADRDTSSATPRWLDAVEQEHWRAYLRGSRLLEVALDRDLQHHGLQLSEYEIISMLSEARDRHLRMSEIADLVVQSRSRLTHTATRLERRGWVRRQPSTDDRRGVVLVLTPKGQAAIDGMAPWHVESVRTHLIDHLSPEQFARLGEAMAAVRDGLSAHHTEVPGETATAIDGGREESRPA